MKELICEILAALAVIFFVFLIAVELLHNNHDKQSYLQPIYFTETCIELEKKALEIERREIRLQGLRDMNK